MTIHVSTLTFRSILDSIGEAFSANSEDSLAVWDYLTARDQIGAHSLREIVNAEIVDVD